MVIQTRAVRVETRRRPAIRVEPSQGVAVLAATVPGAQGPQGVQGQPGPQNSGFGTIDYSDLDAGTPLLIPAGAWVRMTRALAPSSRNRNLPRGPWQDFAFWNGGALRARAEGDDYRFKFSFRVMPAQRGSSIQFGLWPGGDPAFDFGPGPILIAADAGQTERSSASFSQTAGSRFVAAGAHIMVTSSAGATLLEFSPEITPAGYNPSLMP